MGKTKMKKGIWLYFLIGLVVSILSLLVSIPLSILLTAFVALSGTSIFTILGIIVWIPIAFVISGYIIVKVVQWFGFRKIK